LISIVILATYPHIRDLPSFPTRRSSDLGGAERGVAQVPEDQEGEDGAPAVARLSDADPKRHVRGTDRSPADHLPRPPRSRAPDRDRKSTRLNSSHVSISYAVFCLKKKMN